MHKYQGRGTRDIWSRMPAEERVETFKKWLLQPENIETLVMLDDLDGLADPELILSAIPLGAKTQDGELYNRDVLREIAKAVHGHPLAASHAIKYIIRVISQEPVDSPAETFLSILEDPNHETRASFLEYKPRAPSIMDTFYVSRNRLPNPKGLAWTLMQFLSILEANASIVPTTEISSTKDNV
ncbi:hypothetical protein BKA61DRAFT_667428 [Leptodontidium sp. MPI-SDFR-AT-0119]|nr:hypothetical protein BKA61DRAFT_667428 [Leptodontidium sp. MPI-SDFR-AT-0119]